MRHKRFVTTAIACSVMPLQATIAADPPEVRIDAIFANYTATTPGCAVGVERAGATLYAKAFGAANLQGGRPLSPRSSVYMASVSKQVTAMAILLLVQDGKLRLDSRVSGIIPELPVYASTVTVAQLLNHTSGVRDYFGLGELDGLPEDHAYTEADMLRLLSRQKALNFEPGSEFLYSNSGYVLLSMIVQRVSGQKLDDFARARIFTPLGMANSRFQHDHTAAIPDRANGYEDKDGRWQIANSNLDVTGDGGLYSSVEDMLKWLANLDHPIVGKDALAVMRTPARLTDGSSTGYGMGLETSRFHGLEVVEHGGALAGYRTMDMWFPQQKLGVVVLCNSAKAQPGDLAEKVAAAFLGDALKPVSTPVAVQAGDDIRPFAGLYRGPTGNYVEFAFREGRLVTLPGEPLIEVAPAEFVFQSDPDGERLLFNPDAHTAQVRRADRPALTLQWVEKSDPTESAGTAFAGDYMSVEASAPIHIRQAGKLTFALGDGPAEPLVQTGVDRLWSPTTRIEFAFSHDTTGTLNGFTMNAGRARGLKYERRHAQ